MMNKRKVVMIAGKFDPLHDGHIDHIRRAATLGDYLIVITHKDEVIDKVKYPRKHNIPLWARIMVLKGILTVYFIKGDIRTSVDEDGTVSETIRLIKPDIFAKGGDRTASNMPQSEIDACREVGCEIVYGIGDLLNSSTKIAENG